MEEHLTFHCAHLKKLHGKIFQWRFQETEMSIKCLPYAWDQSSESFNSGFLFGKGRDVVMGVMRDRERRKVKSSASQAKRSPKNVWWEAVVLWPTEHPRKQDMSECNPGFLIWIFVTWQRETHSSPSLKKIYISRCSYPENRKKWILETLSQKKGRKKKKERNSFCFWRQ